MTGAGGGGKITQTPPGATSVFQFKAMNPGVYIYHCATPMIPYHLAHGTYGLMVVEPPGGWPKVDREFYVMQGDIYLKANPAQGGMHEASVEKMEEEHPDFVVFNGSAGSLAKEHALKAKAGETVRIFFGNAGPNSVSSFHVIGEIFEKVPPKERLKRKAMCSRPLSPRAEPPWSNPKPRSPEPKFSSIMASGDCKKARPDSSRSKDRPIRCPEHQGGELGWPRPITVQVKPRS